MKNKNMLISFITGAAVLLVAAAGSYALYGHTMQNQAAVDEEEDITPNVAYFAKKANMSIEDYLAQFGLKLGGDITPETTESDMYDNMTLEYYCRYRGDKSAEQIIEEYNLQDKVTKDTLWKDFRTIVPVSFMIDEETLEKMKQQYGLGDKVTPDMPYGEFTEIFADATKPSAEELAEKDAALAAQQANQ